MTNPSKLESQIAEYAQLGKENKNVDVAALMLDALAKHDANTVSGRSKRWAYLIAIGAPPFGLLFALYYYFSEKNDAKRVALWCVVLTIIALLGLWLFFHVLISSSGLGEDQLRQIEQIKPEQIQELYQ